MSNAIITARHLYKNYGSIPVLENLNFQVKAGEFVTIVGASGCGKTSFLKLLLGTEKPSRGRLELDRQPLPAEPGPERGVVFQRYSVFPHLTVLQNVVFGLEISQSRWLGKLFGAAKRRVEEEAKH